MATNEKPDAGIPSDPAPVSPTRRRWWQRMLGLKRRPGKFFRWGLTKWGVFVLFVFGFLIGSAAFAEYSMQPAFCQSCHIMEPYYQAWHQSTHKNVPCVDCHFPPGAGNVLYGKF